MPSFEPLRFADRSEAGRQLGVRLKRLRLDRPIIYALPRGGVPVGVEVAAALDAPLDLVLVRKLGAPFQPELAVGAVVDGGEPETVLNPEIIALTGTREDYIVAAREREIAEIERRRRRYLADRPGQDPRGRAAVVVDDGLATGATARAALHALRRRGPAQLILAVPVASPDSLVAIRPEADQVVCLHEADLVCGIGGFYGDFHQLTDAEVIRLLDAAAARNVREGGGQPTG
jgi:putative phosphoribosyl transferase